MGEGIAEMLLSEISSPEDVKALDASEIPQLCKEIRQTILTSTSVVGGHVASNLAVVELTVAIHRVFESPRDKIIFDVSHQSYTHKMLTGRAGCYLDPERYSEVSGFACTEESEHDLFTMGHTSTSIGLACGMAHARDLAGESYDVVAVIGDGSLSGGLAYEGLDALGELGCGVIVVVNDNGWSIAEDHGGLYKNLAELRRTNGEAPCNIFRALGLDYRFLANGNDEAAVEEALRELKGTDHPVVLHICTTKGMGYEPAMEDPEDWHHVGSFDLETGAITPPADRHPESAESYAEITGAYLSERIAADPSVVAISAATPYIMGFTPERRAAAGGQYVDTGIAEEHAVTFATGLARGGAKPVLGLYGVFLQRAYDELWHDMCLNSAPVTILDFGASVHGANDATHLCFFDLALQRPLPNLTCLAPVSREEYLAMLDWAIDQTEGPVVIRVPGAEVISRPDLAPDAGTTFDEPRYQVVRAGSEVAILALGSIFTLGEQVADELAARAGIHATFINPRFATTFDEELLAELPKHHRCAVTLEDGVLEGGWGEGVARILGPSDMSTLCYGIHKGFPDRFDADELLAQNGVTLDGIVQDIMDRLA